jgi:hypothetical protein
MATEDPPDSYADPYGTRPIFGGPPPATGSTPQYRGPHPGSPSEQPYPQHVGAQDSRPHQVWSANYAPAEPVSRTGPPGYRPPQRRGRTVATIVGLGALGLAAGIGVGILVNQQPGNGDVGMVSQTPAPVPANAPGASPTAGAGTSTTEPTPSLSATSTADYSPLPEDPSTVNADFGFLTAISQSGSRVSVKFDRAQFLTGDAAKAANGGQAPDDDYLIKNTNPAVRTFTVAPKASLAGYARLNNQNNAVQRETLTMTQFVENAQHALTQDGKIPVWLRHTNGLAGDITALAEQYLP